MDNAEHMLIKAMSDPVGYMKRAVLSELSWKATPARQVRRGQTCPRCGRSGINTYPHDGRWICKQCIDAANQ